MANAATLQSIGYTFDEAIFEVPAVRVGFAVAEACRKNGVDIKRKKDYSGYFKRKREALNG